LTSANDCPERDPRDWDLLGSNDGNAWTTLDSRNGESFSQRFEEKNYTCANSSAYRYYRLSIRSNAGGGETQLSDMKLFADI